MMPTAPGDRTKIVGGTARKCCRVMGPSTATRVTSPLEASRLNSFQRHCPSSVAVPAVSPATARDIISSRTLAASRAASTSWRCWFSAQGDALRNNRPHHIFTSSELRKRSSPGGTLSSKNFCWQSAQRKSDANQNMLLPWPRVPLQCSWRRSSTPTCRKLTSPPSTSKTGSNG